MNILVTGGTGYIGSHTVVELLAAGYNIVIADNLINSKSEVIDYIEEISGKKVKFYEMDICDEDKLEQIFIDNKIDGIVHFAGLKAVGESVTQAIRYYRNNLTATMNLCYMCEKYDVKNFIFSSSATVYGENKSPFIETMELGKTTNPYGETKVMSERILTDFANSVKGMKVTLLRYFNPLGAHPSGLIGEIPNGVPNNLLPYIAQVAVGIRDKLYIFGDDYETVDGTGVRDYIHVMDLAEGHVAALSNMNEGIDIYNLGTGIGVSVFQLIHTFEIVNDVKIPYEIVARRVGDIATCYANSDKAKKDLIWEAKRNLEDMCKSSWNFYKTRR